MTPSIDQILHQFANLLPTWTSLPIWTLLPNFGGFHRTVQRVWLANRGRLLLRTPGPVPFGNCICSNVETIFTWACQDFGLWISNIPVLLFYLSVACLALMAKQSYFGHFLVYRTHDGDPIKRTCSKSIFPEWSRPLWITIEWLVHTNATIPLPHMYIYICIKSTCDVTLLC